MSIYPFAPSLNASSIPERVDCFRRTCVKAVRNGDLTINDLIAAAEDALNQERYEMTQGINEALKELGSLH